LMASPRGFEPRLPP